jgi:enamine deaminase RidA (YjgF/YER057c/UK114 family)
MSAEQRLAALGLTLPPAPEPIASYVTFVRSGNTAYTAGHGPRLADGSMLAGKVGLDLDANAAREAARAVGLGLLATLRHHLGSLDRVTRVVKVLGMVNATPEFAEHSVVIDGCSELLLRVFGQAGRHARSAVGVASLPGNIPVEIEVVLEVD